jgi:hypothetical protein
MFLYLSILKKNLKYLYDNKIHTMVNNISSSKSQINYKTLINIKKSNNLK